MATPLGAQDEHGAGDSDGATPFASTSGNDGAHQHQHHPHHRASLRNMPSNLSRASSAYPNQTAVELDHFDPTGMKQLKRKLTEDDPSHHPAHGAFLAASHSDLTLHCCEIGDGPFDFDKFLRG